VTTAGATATIGVGADMDGSLAANTGLSIENGATASARRYELLDIRLGDEEPLLNELDDVFKFDIFSLASFNSNTHSISLMFFFIFSSFIKDEIESK